MVFECPGSEGVKRPTPENIKCPFCSGEVEIWTDEVEAVCPNCEKTVAREQRQSCLEWCSYAKECVGEGKYNMYMKNRTVSVKDELLKELEEFFGRDTKRIDHAKRVLGFSEELLKSEKAGWNIVIPASILHDVGIKIAEDKYGSAAGHYQEAEGPPIARGILIKVGFKKEDIDEICQIIANHHSPGKVDTLNFKVLYDADWLVNLKDEVDMKDKERLSKAIDKIFLTETGKKMARELYLWYGISKDRNSNH
jgi:HD superfamily phosphodiesterase